MFLLALRTFRTSNSYLSNSGINIVLRILLNILWFIFGGGFLIFLSYAIVGVLLCISIIGIPFGLQ